MANQKYILLFDGVCNLCNGTVDFILKRDKKKQFEFIPLQSEEGKKLLEKFQISKAIDSVILIKDSTVFKESEAAIEIGKLLPQPWKWAGVFRFIPLKIRDSIYRWVARNRYRWFGKRESCRIIQN